VIVDAAFPSPEVDCEYEQLVVLEGDMELVEFEVIAVEFAVVLEVEFPGTDREPVVFTPVFESDVELELDVSVVLVVDEEVVVEQVVDEFVARIVDELVIGVVVELVVIIADEFVDTLVAGTEPVLFVASIGRDVIGIVVEVVLVPDLSAMTPTATMAMMITTTTTAAMVETALFFGFNGS
jgi:hypothetical protein